MRDKRSESKSFYQKKFAGWKINLNVLFLLTVCDRSTLCITLIPGKLCAIGRPISHVLFLPIVCGSSIPSHTFTFGCIVSDWGLIPHGYPLACAKHSPYCTTGLIHCLRFSFSQVQWGRNAVPFHYMYME